MKKIIFVEGLNHIQMGSAVSHILESVSGVDRVRLNLDQEAVIVDYEGDQITDEELCDAINEEGFQVVEIYNEDE